MKMTAIRQWLWLAPILCVTACGRPIEEVPDVVSVESTLANEDGCAGLAGTGAPTITALRAPMVWPSGMGFAMDALASTYNGQIPSDYPAADSPARIRLRINGANFNCANQVRVTNGTATLTLTPRGVRSSYLVVDVPFTSGGFSPFINPGTLQVSVGLGASYSAPLNLAIVRATLPPLAGALSSKSSTTCARVKTTGAYYGVQCWGDNHYGQLGDGTRCAPVNNDPTTCESYTFPNSKVPVQVATLDGLTPALNAIAVAAASGHVCAIAGASTQGTVYCWGHNTSNELGTTLAANTPGTNSRVPVQEVSGITKAMAIATGSTEPWGYGHTCAVIGNSGVGSLKCWGDNSYGESAPQSPGAWAVGATTPTGAVTASDTAKGVAVGANHACVLLTSNVVRCWGDNSYGQLGDAASPIPGTNVYPLQSLSNVRAIVAAGLHTCAELTDGTVWCWGGNFNGELGTEVARGSFTATPQLRQTASVSFTTSQNGLATGISHSCALSTPGTSPGTLKCWGINTNGIFQLGNSSAPDPSTDLVTLTNGNTSNPIDAFTLGAAHGCLLQNGNVSCWGGNGSGQLGGTGLATLPSGSCQGSCTSPVTVWGLQATPTTEHFSLGATTYTIASGATSFNVPVTLLSDSAPTNTTYTVRFSVSPATNLGAALDFEIDTTQTAANGITLSPNVITMSTNACASYPCTLSTNIPFLYHPRATTLSNVQFTVALGTPAAGSDITPVSSATVTLKRPAALVVADTVIPFPNSNPYNIYVSRVGDNTGAETADTVQYAILDSATLGPTFATNGSDFTAPASGTLTWNKATTGLTGLQPIAVSANHSVVKKFMVRLYNPMGPTPNLTFSGTVPCPNSLSGGCFWVTLAPSAVYYFPSDTPTIGWSSTTQSATFQVNTTSTISGSQVGWSVVDTQGNSACGINNSGTVSGTLTFTGSGVLAPQFISLNLPSQNGTCSFEISLSSGGTATVTLTGPDIISLLPVTTNRKDGVALFKFYRSGTLAGDVLLQYTTYDVNKPNPSATDSVFAPRDYSARIASTVVLASGDANPDDSSGRNLVSIPIATFNPGLTTWTNAQLDALTRRFFVKVKILSGPAIFASSVYNAGTSNTDPNYTRCDNRLAKFSGVIDGAAVPICDANGQNDASQAVGTIKFEPVSWVQFVGSGTYNDTTTFALPYSGAAANPVQWRVNRMASGTVSTSLVTRATVFVRKPVSGFYYYLSADAPTCNWNPGEVGYKTLQYTVPAGYGWGNTMLSFDTSAGQAWGAGVAFSPQGPTPNQNQVHPEDNVMWSDPAQGFCGTSTLCTNGQATGDTLVKCGTCPMGDTVCASLCPAFLASITCQ